MLSCNNKCNNRRVYIGKILSSPAWNSDDERPDTWLEQMEYIIIDGVVYYISQFDEKPEVKLYILSHIRIRVLVKYHNGNDHLAVKKRFPSLKKCFWL